MRKAKRTPAGAALTDLILDLFRLNSRMLVAGDRLVAGLARDLGAARQNVQRIVNDLVKEGFVALATNPHHRRAPLVMLTDKGRKTFEAAMGLQVPWVNRLSAGLRAE